MDKSIFVLHNGHKSVEITRDCALRMQAAAELAKGNPKAIICFVGGGGLKPISGAQSMRDFWRKEYAHISNPVEMLENSNNTAASIREIAQFISGKNMNGGMIISSAYHTKRIKHFVCRHNLIIEVLGAEEVLQIKKYYNSLKYFTKQIMEWIMVAYVTMDKEQRIVGFWRKHFRGKN